MHRAPLQLGGVLDEGALLGKQIPNWKFLEEFHADLDQLGIPRQRQYLNRSSFRNLLLAAGAKEFHVNLMTHPSPKQASDMYAPGDAMASDVRCDPAARSPGVARGRSSRPIETVRRTVGGRLRWWRNVP